MERRIAGLRIWTGRGMEMMEQRRAQIARLEEEARHIREVLDGDSTAGTEVDSLEIEWSAALSENLPELDTAYRTGEMEDPEQADYGRLKALLREMSPLLHRWKFSEPAEVLRGSSP